MANYYYLTIFPMEALVASQLGPEEFGSYMAIGSRKGSAERLMFFSVEEGASDAFDWEYAKEQTVPHADGRPKHSVYLSVYRTLENLPVSSLGDLYLTTVDGRTLKLDRGEYAPPEAVDGIFVYKELCPIHPVVVSNLAPREFAGYLTGEEKISLPKIVSTDLKMINPSDYVHTGNIGRLYDRSRAHLESCIQEIKSRPAKKTKILDRSHSEIFSYQAINRGIYVADHENFVMYRMKTEDELKQNYYDWGKSSQIL